MFLIYKTADNSCLHLVQLLYFFPGKVMWFYISRVLIYYLTTTSYCITKTSVHYVSTIRTVLLIIHMMVDDEASSYVVVEGLITPHAAHMSVGKF